MKAFTLVGLALGLLLAAPAAAEDGKKSFPDVPREQWAFDAVQQLANGLFSDSKGAVLKGYPDGTYQGSRALTRYEMAAAFQRLEERIRMMVAASFQPLPARPGPPGLPGFPGPKGERGEPGLPGPPEEVPRELQDLQRELPQLRGDAERLKLQFGGYRGGLGRLREEVGWLKDRLGALSERVEKDGDVVPVPRFIQR